MGKNTGIGGKKGKRGKKNFVTDRELTYKEEMQDYAQVLRLLGDSRLEVQCMDGVKRAAHIRGTMRKKVWIANGEVRKLKSLGEIPASIKLPENEVNKEEGGDIIFQNDSDEEEDGVVNKNKKNKKQDLPSSESEDSDEEEKEIDIDNI
jgi:translation initiation factor 1A